MALHGFLQQHSFLVACDYATLSWYRVNVRFRFVNQFFVTAN